MELIPRDQSVGLRREGVIRKARKLGVLAPVCGAGVGTVNLSDSRYEGGEKIELGLDRTARAAVPHTSGYGENLC